MLRVGFLCGWQPGVNGVASKPVPPPRDHLRIEKDGRLVNRAPAPQVPARTASAAVTPAIQNNNTDPTKEQLDSIRKFQVSSAGTCRLVLATRVRLRSNFHCLFHVIPFNDHFHRGPTQA